MTNVSIRGRSAQKQLGHVVTRHLPNFKFDRIVTDSQKRTLGGVLLQRFGATRLAAQDAKQSSQGQSA
jgi:hypothetical protein